MRHLILAVSLFGTIPPAYAIPSCPRDTVVWLNQRTGAYHLPGDRWYGHTKNGAYVCEKQAATNGGHMSGVRGTGHPAGQHNRSGRHGNVDKDGPEGDRQPEGALSTGEIENPF